jgi:ABC-type lipoprotein release transport system permease subunit
MGIPIVAGRGFERTDRPTDVLTIGFVIATITGVAVVASWVPAWRASRVDPNVVLRDE